MNRITTNGKQILFDGQHIADAVSSEIAEVIASNIRSGQFASLLKPVPARLWQNDPISGTTARQVDAATDCERVSVQP